MHQTKAIIDALAAELKNRISGLTFSYAYSVSKDEMMMVFSNQQQVFVLRMITRWRNLLLFYSDVNPKKESNARALFEDVNLSLIHI